MLKQRKYKNLSEAAIRQAAKRHQIQIKEICIADDHIHVVVNPPIDMSISSCVNMLKGVSSRLMFKEQPKFRLRYPQGQFWSRGYFTRSTGSAARETVENYVKEHGNNQATLSEYG